jgi:hypothetical protein
MGVTYSISTQFFVDLLERYFLEEAKYDKDQDHIWPSPLHDCFDAYASSWNHFLESKSELTRDQTLRLKVKESPERDLLWFR